MNESDATYTSDGDMNGHMNSTNAPQPGKKRGQGKAKWIVGMVVLSLASCGMGVGLGAAGSSTPAPAPTAAESSPQAPVAPSNAAAPSKSAAPAAPAVKDVPYEDQAALTSAQSYIDMAAFSKKSLRKQLAFEKHPEASVKYAVENVNADWVAEAKESLASYQQLGSLSKSELRAQLEFEGFTASEVDAAMASMN